MSARYTIFRQAKQTSKERISGFHAPIATSGHQRVDNVEREIKTQSLAELHFAQSPNEGTRESRTYLNSSLEGWKSHGVKSKSQVVSKAVRKQIVSKQQQSKPWEPESRPCEPQARWLSCSDDRKSHNNGLNRVVYSYGRELTRVVASIQSCLYFAVNKIYKSTILVISNTTLYLEQYNYCVTGKVQSR